MTQRPSNRCGVITTLVVSLLMSACASQSVRKPAPVPTIADLPASSIDSGQVPTTNARDKAITAYRDYLQRYPDSQDRAEIMRRIADLLLERGADGLAMVPNSQAVLDRARRDYDEAADIYERLLALQAEDTEDTQLRYQLARAYEESGRPARATAILGQLVQTDSGEGDRRLYADAQFRRGELLFSKGEFREAEQAYRSVVDLGESVPLYRQSRYKLAWSLFKLTRYQQALLHFFAVLDHSIPPNVAVEPYIANLSRAEQEQLDDVFRGISLCFFHTGGVDKVVAYFDRDKHLAYQERVYLDLAELYLNKEFFSDAGETFLTLAKQDPFDPAAPRLYIKVIELYQRAGLKQQALRIEADFASIYGIDDQFRTRHPLQTIPDVARQLESSLVDLAHHDHARFREKRSTEDYHSAEKWYRAYLLMFHDSARAAEMNLGLALLFYDAERYRQAALQFDRTAYSLGEHRVAAEAGRFALRAYDRHLEELDGEKRDSWSILRISSAKRFIETFPGHSDAPVILTRVGVEMLESDQALETARLSQQILEQSPSPTALRGAAWSLLGQARYQLADYSAAEQAYRQALTSGVSDDKQRVVIKKGLAAALYKQAEERLMQGDQRQASVLFQRAANEAADTTIRGRARYDAAAALLALQEWQRAAQLLEAFQDNHPDHPLQREAARKLAFAYERGGRHRDAAALYLQLGITGNDHELRRQALVRAAALYQQSGLRESAISALKRYVNDFPRPPERLVDIYQQLAELQQAVGDENSRLESLRQVIAAESAAGEAADRHSHLLAAEATLVLAERRAVEFRRIQLVDPLEESLRAKLQALQSALMGFEQAKSYGVAEVTTASTYQIADMYQELSRALLASERPSGLEPGELSQYERLLAEQAAPFQRKAIEIHETNVRRIAEGEYDIWIEKSLRRLASLWPARYAKEERGESQVEKLR